MTDADRQNWLFQEMDRAFQLHPFRAVLKKSNNNENNPGPTSLMKNTK